MGSNINYKEFVTCEKCGKETRGRFQGKKLCYDCTKPLHQDLNIRLGTDKKLVYKTNINYDKYRNK